MNDLTLPPALAAEFLAVCARLGVDPADRLEKIVDSYLQSARGYEHHRLLRQRFEERKVAVSDRMTRERC